MFSSLVHSLRHKNFKKCLFVTFDAQIDIRVECIRQKRVFLKVLEAKCFLSVVNCFFFKFFRLQLQMGFICFDLFQT